jgi:hypothetical protein
LDGYGIDLPPQGAELLQRDKSRNKAHVDGLYKLDKKGERTDQIPCHFEGNRKRWTMTMVMSADEKTARRVGLALQIQRQTNTPANICKKHAKSIGKYATRFALRIGDKHMFSFCNTCSKYPT